MKPGAIQVRVRGVNKTDQQTYDFLSADCGPSEPGSLEFGRLERLDAPGLERMSEAIGRHCGGRAFCPYEARAVVVGRLVKDADSTFGMLLEVVEVQEYEILEHKK